MSGLYAAIDTDLDREEKFLDFCIEMGLEHDHAKAIGILTLLWMRVTDMRPDGCLEGWTPKHIKRLVGWDGPCAQLINALRGPEGSPRFLETRDTILWVRNWREHTGRMLWKRTKDADRKRNAREKEAQIRASAALASADRPRTKRTESGRVRYDGTGRDGTGPDGTGPLDRINLEVNSKIPLETDVSTGASEGSNLTLTIEQPPLLEVPISLTALVAGKLDDAPKTKLMRDKALHEALAKIHQHAWSMPRPISVTSKAFKTFLTAIVEKENRKPSDIAAAIAGMRCEKTGPGFSWRQHNGWDKLAKHFDKFLITGLDAQPRAFLERLAVAVDAGASATAGATEKARAWLVTDEAYEATSPEPAGDAIAESTVSVPAKAFDRSR